MPPNECRSLSTSLHSSIRLQLKCFAIDVRPFVSSVPQIWIISLSLLTPKMLCIYFRFAIFTASTWYTTDSTVDNVRSMPIMINLDFSQFSKFEKKKKMESGNFNHAGDLVSHGSRTNFTINTLHITSHKIDFIIFVFRYIFRFWHKTKTNKKYIYYFRR